MPKIDEKPKRGESWFCHDENCPKCGYPETLTVVKGKAFVRRICSRRGCDWQWTQKKATATHD